MYTNIDISDKYNELIEKGLKLEVDTKKNKLIIHDAKGRKREADVVADDNKFDLIEMINYIKALNEPETPTNDSLVIMDLPVRAADLNSDFDLTPADLEIWDGLRFTDESSKFYVKDKKDRETYTVFLTSASTGDTADAKILKEAFYNSEYSPEILARHHLKKYNIHSWDDFNEVWRELPATAWKYYKAQAYKNGNETQLKRLVVLRGNADALYKEFLGYEGQFRRVKKLDDTPVNLTNDLNTPAIAYIDLEKLEKDHKGQTSKLWDEFLLQRLHNPDYVSIFKAWSYAVIVGRNNSRQEMWLYGNGGTGKSCLCKAFIKGINKLAGKNICLAASKDTGKSNFNSEILNKHLLVYADAKNLKGGMSEFKHNATGGDTIRIEGKSKEATSGEVYLKCLTCSNELPKLDTTDRSQSSRIIVLPFSLTDDELKQYKLMDTEGQLIGSADFQSRLNNEFELYLASCREHYIRRCPRDSNIDAHEAKEYLESISTSEIEALAEFVDTYFEITTNTKDRITVKDFRKQCLFGVNDVDEDTCVKTYKDIKVEDVYSYLERKYGLIRKNILVVVDGDKDTPKGLTSKTHGIKIKHNKKSTIETPQENVFAD